MLYIVATPIGNLQDITFRAVETLKSVDKIYCEDTRRTRLLLNAYQIDKPLESFHHHSPETKISNILTELRGGNSLAYVTDAGTPGIADPGGKLVSAVRTAGYPIVPIPGPSAVTTILSVAGIYTNAYFFAGYIPTKKGRQTFIKEMLELDIPVVFFETAHRFPKLLTELVALGGQDRQLIVGRELTKKFEQIMVGKPVELPSQITELLGELVIVLSPSN